MSTLKKYIEVFFYTFDTMFIRTVSLGIESFILYFSGEITKSDYDLIVFPFQ